MKLLVIIDIFVFVAVAVAIPEYSPPYYWRDYNGIIPADAIRGGFDSNHSATYIGQGFVDGQGILPGIIYPGQKEMSVPIYGVKTVKSYIKILCSSEKESFTWMPFHYSYFKTDAMRNKVVEGGIEQNNLVYIGRANYQGDVVPGKLVDWKYLYFVRRQTEMKMETFQYLVYDNSRGGPCLNFLYK